VPLPEPLAEVTVSHEALDVAVHAHPVGEVRVTLPVPAPAETDCVVADNANVQATPACVTLNAWPPTVIVAERETPAVFAVYVNVIVALLDPLAGDTVSQVWLDAADQVHPEGEVSENVPEPAAAPTEADAGDSAKVHVTPCWVTVSVWPPTVTVAVRDVVDVFAV
jgi:hypothetical protein